MQRRPEPAYFPTVCSATGEVFKFICKTHPLALHAAASFFTTLATVSANLFSPYLFSRVIDAMATTNTSEVNKNTSGVPLSFFFIESYTFTTLFSLTLIARTILPTINTLLVSPIKGAYSAQKNVDIQTAIAIRDLEFHLQNPAGRLLGTVRQAYTADEFIPTFFEALLPTTLELITAICILMSFDWELGLILLGSATINVILIAALTPRLTTAYSKHIMGAIQLYGGIITRIDRYFQTELFNAQSNESLDIQAEAHSYRKQLMGITLTPAHTTLAQSIWLGVSFSSMLLYSLYKYNDIDQENFDFNTFILIAIYLLQTLSPLSRSGKSIAELGHYALANKKAADFIKASRPPAEHNLEPVIHVSPATADVNFNGVVVTGHDGTTLLNEASFNIPAGSKTAIVGLSGAGKTSLARTLLGFYTPQEGHITVAGTNIQQISRHVLRKIVTLVPQDPTLLRKTLRDNLKYACEDDVTDAELLMTLKAVGLDDQGMQNRENSLIDLDKMLGVRGGTLSGGQKKRLAAARAILRAARICILDEPTAGLDFQSAQTVTSKFNELLLNTTLITITHDLRTMPNFDHIILIEDGTVREEGSFQHLTQAENRGRFYNLLHGYCLQHSIDVQKLLAASATTERQEPRPPLSTETTSYHQQTQHHNGNPLRRSSATNANIGVTERDSLVGLVRLGR